METHVRAPQMCMVYFCLLTASHWSKNPLLGAVHGRSRVSLTRIPPLAHQELFGGKAKDALKDVCLQRSVSMNSLLFGDILNVRAPSEGPRSSKDYLSSCCYLCFLLFQRHAYASWIMSVLVFLGCGQVREWCMRLFSGVDSAGQADACAGGA
eukprot:1156351-Pelagomonas_calceolata.AAC.21